MTQAKIQFPGLNTVRFIAASAVVVTHIEQVKSDLHMSSLFYNPWIQGLGPSSVSLFFTLSGFLITYLLLVERQRTDAIDVTRFYVRRMLRIWPLYYLVLVWAFFLLPRMLHLGNYSEQLLQHYYAQLLLFVFILPNISLVLYGPVSGAAQAWSIGVEEQFYLIWPHVIKSAKTLLPTLVLIIAGKLLLMMALAGIVSHGQRFGLSATAVQRIGLAEQCLALIQIENMTMGAIAAWLYLQGRLQRFSFLLSGPAKAAIIALTFLLIGCRAFFLHPIVEAATFAVLIIQIVGSPEFWRKWESAALWHLGNISYGIYMFHITPVFFVMAALARFPALAANSLALNALLYTLSFALTLALSHVSYRYFESPFLRLKKQFTVVKSGGA